MAKQAQSLTPFSDLLDDEEEEPEDEEFLVEKILDQKQVYGRNYYLVKVIDGWRGCMTSVFIFIFPAPVV